MDKGKLKMDNCQLSTVNSQLRKNYKQTEMGIIPEDWDMKKLDSISSSVASGKSDTKPSNGIYPIYGSTGIIGLSNKFDYEGEKILVARVGANAGTVNWVTGKYCVSDNTLMVQLKNDVCFLYAVFFMRLCNLNKLVFGSGQPLITGSQLKQLPIPLPLNKAEQAAIATALSDADALISSLEKLIAKKRNIKQGAMQQLLTGKKRLPGFSGKWKVTDNGQLKIKNGKLGDLFQINQLRKPIGIDEIVTFIGMEDVSENGKIIKHNLLPFAEIKKGLTYFQKNDVLVAKITPCFENGKGACLDNLKTEKGFGSTEFYILRANNNSVSRYIFYHTQSEKFRRRLEAEMVGSAGQKRVSASAILNYPLSIVHSKAEQTAIAHVLSDMDAEIEALEKKLEKYKMIKQGMMQNLLTGKIRLV